MKIKLIFLALLLAFSACTKDTIIDDNGSEGGGETPSEVVESYWWPEQKAPSKVLLLKNINTNNSAPNMEIHALAQSLSGLAAQAVNAETNNEMVWINIPNNAYYSEWYSSTLSRLGLSTESDIREFADVWDLVDYLKSKGVVKGYILYKKDTSTGNFFEQRSGINHSINSATILAGIAQAVLVDESLEATAKIHGLEKLGDGRIATPLQSIMENRLKLNKKAALTVDPKVAHNRDMAIAHKLMVSYDIGETTSTMMSLLNPASPILGWNTGGEDKHTMLATRYALFNTASNWSMNLSFLCAGAKSAERKRVKSIDPKTINFAETGKRYHSFVMSDGDNVGWKNSNFFGDVFFGAPDNKSIPMSWTSCSSMLSMVNPCAWNKIVDEMSEHNTFIEYGGGYMYPDHFGKDRQGGQEENLRLFMRKVNENLKVTGVRVFGFICMEKLDDERTRKACQIIVDEIEVLTGIIAVKYSPYNDNKGDVFWIKNRQGVDIPVVAPKYSLWKGISAAGSGDPTKIAGLINNDPLDNCFTIVHAWSKYGTDDIQGTQAVAQCKSDINSNSVKVVSLEELLWRIRMKHNPEETKKVLGL